jgi:hypothetical protein
MSRTSKLTFEVTGDAVPAVALTYTNGDGEVEQCEAVAPWTLAFPVACGRRIYLSAYNLGVGTLRVRVLVDGWVWQESEATGQNHVVVVCGIVP